MAEVTLYCLVTHLDLNHASRRPSLLGRSFSFGNVLTGGPGAQELKKQFCGAHMAFSGGRFMPSATCPGRRCTFVRGEAYPDEVGCDDDHPETGTDRAGMKRGSGPNVPCLDNKASMKEVID